MSRTTSMICDKDNETTVVIMPYFPAISQTVAEILRFNAGRPPSWIFRIGDFNDW